MSNIQRWKSKNKTHLPRPFSGRLDPGWTEYSIAVRLPEIVKRVIAENAFPQEIVDRLENLRSEIPYQPLRDIVPDGYGDWQTWNEILSEYRGQTWFEVPWLVCEFYLYRRILEATGYFNEGPFLARDPYQFQKSEGFVASLNQINDLLEWIDGQKAKGASVQSIFGDLIKHNLEGNRVDLSLWPVSGGQSQNQPAQEAGDDKFLSNDLPELLSWMFSRKMKQVDLLMDNAGFEMLSDLCMITFLLEQEVIERGVLHVKPYPVFVSDVIKEDVALSIRLLTGQERHYPHLVSLGRQLEEYVVNGRLVVMNEEFWGLPYAFWDMDAEMEENLAKSDLIISKGDANYRRLVGDRRWDPLQPFESVVSYLPASIFAIRVIKSEPGVGFGRQEYTHMTETDPEWMKNGQWGTLQFWDSQTQ